MRTSIRAVGAALAAAGLMSLPMAASAGGGGGGGCAGFRSGATVVMRDSCFDGVAHFAEQGTALVIENRGNLPHSFTAVDGSFDTGMLQPGEQAEIAVGPDGLVRVFCSLHGTRDGAGMAGVLLVGRPEVGAIGTGAGSAAALADHESRRAGAAEAQAESLAHLEKGQMDSQRSAAGLTALTGLTAALAAAAAVGAWVAVGHRRRQDRDAPQAEAPGRFGKREGALVSPAGEHGAG